jgi:quercetin dioxygenase-like cupin family protein
MSRNLICLSIALLIGPAAVAESAGTVEIDNPWVRVLRVKAGPHQKIPMHEHPASVLVCLTDVDERTTAPDGKSQEVTHKAGDVAYREPMQHAEENLSDQPLEVIVVELKPGAPKAPPAPMTAPDPMEADPVHHSVPVENDRVRVLRTVLEPHLKGPVHRHRSYVVVYLTGLHTTMKLADGRMVDNPRKPGEVAFRNAYQHQTENIGDKTAVEIQIELK